MQKQLCIYYYGYVVHIWYILDLFRAWKISKDKRTINFAKYIFCVRTKYLKQIN